MPKVNHHKNIVEIRNLSFAYDQETILKDVNFDIHEGDYIGLIGPNGAGKSTLFKLIMGILKPATGQIKIFDQDLSAFKDWQKLAYVPQRQDNIQEKFPASVSEIVALGLINLTANNQTESLIKESLQKVGLNNKADKLISELSGGERQRVMLAKALASGPQILFLDEATSGVDQKTQDSFFQLLKELNEEGLTIIVISHDLERLTKEVMHIACIDKTLTCHLSPAEYLASSESANILGQEVKIISHHHH